MSYMDKIRDCLGYDKPKSEPIPIPDEEVPYEKVFDIPEEIELCDLVEVIDYKYSYRWYNDWSGLKGYESSFAYNEAPINGEVYKVLRLKKHDTYDIELALIKNIKCEVFIIDIKGIKKYRR